MGQGSEGEDQWEGVQDSGKTSTDVRGRDMGIEDGTGTYIRCRRNENGTMDVPSYEAEQSKLNNIINERIKGQREWGIILVIIDI